MLILFYSYHTSILAKNTLLGYYCVQSYFVLFDSYNTVIIFYSKLSFAAS